MADAKQYTVPVPEALESVRKGKIKSLPLVKNIALFYVVPKEGQTLKQIEHDIVTMPTYFMDYGTEVHFIFQRSSTTNTPVCHAGGFVIRNGKSAAGTNQKMEFNLSELGSNPEFTSSAIVCCARAVAKMAKRGYYRRYYYFDIPVGMLFSPRRTNFGENTSKFC